MARNEGGKGKSGQTVRLSAEKSANRNRDGGPGVLALAWPSTSRASHAEAEEVNSIIP